MIVNLAHLLSPLIGLAADMLLQVILLRRRGDGRLLRSVVRGFAGGLCAVFAVEAAWFLGADVPVTDFAGQALFNASVFTALGYGYFHWINLGETARRIRILREIHRAPGGGLSADELLRRYNAAVIVRARLERMLAHGQVVRRKGRFFIGSRKLLVMAQVLTLAKKLLLGRTREVPQTEPVDRGA